VAQVRIYEKCLDHLTHLFFPEIYPYFVCLSPFSNEGLILSLGTILANFSAAMRYC